MNASRGSNLLQKGVLGLGMLISCSAGLVSLILRDYLPVPLSVALIPAVLGFASLGAAAVEVSSTVALAGGALAMAPVVASFTIGLPAYRHQSVLVVQAAFRLAIAADLSIMIPLAFLSIVAGSSIRGLCDGRANPPTWKARP